MRGGYLAIIEASHAPARRSPEAHRLQVRAGENPGFRQVLTTDSLCVFAHESLPFSRIGDAVILGTVFARGSSTPLTGVADGAGWQRGLEKGAALLGQQVWGAYVAMQAGGDGAVDVFRDPMAGLPCYYVALGELTLVFSHVDLLASLGVALRGFNWAALQAHLLFEHFRPSETCLAGIVELVGGTRLRLEAGGRCVLEDWSPWTFAGRNGQLTDEQEAVDLVGRTACSCIKAWSFLFRHSLLGVSGGLDSSIVAASLREAGAAFTCLTVATTDPGGDERQYARELAAALKLELREAFEDLEKVDLRLSHAAHLPRPVARAFAQSSDQAFQALADEIGADAFFSGGGGDNVFCYLTSGAPVADRLLSGCGWSLALQTAQDMGRMTGSSTIKAFRLGFERAYFRSVRYRWPRNDMWLGDRFRERRDARPEHPWLDAPTDGLPGKAAHIAWILGIQNHLEGYGREHARPIISPLLSQPLVEACLRIPTWMWCKGGRNRAVARHAFAGKLPASVIDRLVKGSPDSFEVEIFESRRDEIRDMLANGIVVQEGLLDREAVLAAIDTEAPLGHKAHNRIMAFVDVEAWLRAWKAKM